MLLLRWGTGRFVSSRQLAEIIEQEGRLIRDYYMDSAGDRCAVGVIMDVQSSDGFPTHTRDLSAWSWVELGKALGMSLSTLNNQLLGTPEQRCLDVAAALRALGGRK